MSPHAPWRRSALHQATQAAVASSTWSAVRQGPRARMSSVLYRPPVTQPMEVARDLGAVRARALDPEGDDLSVADGPLRQLDVPTAVGRHGQLPEPATELVERDRDIDVLVTNAIDEPIPTGQRDPPAAAGWPRARDGQPLRRGSSGRAKVNPSTLPLSASGQSVRRPCSCIGAACSKSATLLFCRWRTRSRQMNSSLVSSQRLMPSSRPTGHGTLTSSWVSMWASPGPASVVRRAIPSGSCGRCSDGFGRVRLPER